MSWNPTLDPHTPTGAQVDAIDTLIIPRARDLGGFEVRRALPAPQRQMVGPFIFFDDFGPVEFLSGQGIDVRPHPHIGLATLSYLFEGRMHHRDSLGSDHWVEAGDIALMQAGHGITHSERTDGPMRAAPYRMAGTQAWLALPEGLEDAAPDFRQQRAAALPVLEAEGKRLRLILGEAYGERVALQAPSRLFYADAQLQPHTAIPLPDDHEDRGVYVLRGAVTVAGDALGAGQMAVFRPGDSISLKAGPQGARLMLLGGDTLAGPRYIWWNFVASSPERIEAAKQDWRAGDWQHGRFQLPLGDDHEFIALPEA